jgi:hypothetical protein
VNETADRDPDKVTRTWAEGVQGNCHCMLSLIGAEFGQGCGHMPGNPNALLS